MSQNEVRKNQLIIPPVDGWKEKTYYWVECCMSMTNPIFGCVFYSGFLNDDGTPGSYNGVILSSEDRRTKLEDICYLHVLKELHQEKQTEEDVPNRSKLLLETPEWIIRKLGLDVRDKDNIIKILMARLEKTSDNAKSFGWQNRDNELDTNKTVIKYLKDNQY